MSATDRELLKAQILALRRKLNKITDAEDAAANAAVLGKCYRTRNNYSCPKSSADYWWLYARVVSVKGGVKVLTFQNDKKGQLTLEQERFYARQSLEGYEEISEAVFMGAWRTFISAVKSTRTAPKAKA
jgi:hypothetical protein